LAASGRWAKRSNHRHLLTQQIGRERGQPIVLTFCPAIFDREALAFNITSFFENLLKRGVIISVDDGSLGSALLPGETASHGIVTHAKRLHLRLFRSYARTGSVQFMKANRRCSG
jgi:hypothetical protein